MKSMANSVNALIFRSPFFQEIADRIAIQIV
jgi:hypothetical protein